MKRAIVFVLLAMLFNGLIAQNGLPNDFITKFQENSLALLNDNILSTQSVPGKEIKLVWDTASNLWVFSDSTRYKYDSLGTSLYNTHYNVSGSVARTTFFYDSYDNKIQELQQNWNIFTSLWDSVERNLYTYNQVNTITVRSFQKWVSNTWKNFSKDVYVYNSNWQQTESIHLIWNNNTSKFDSTDHSYYTYSANNKLSEVVNYVWNGTTWQKNLKYTNIQWYEWMGSFYNSKPYSFAIQLWQNNSWKNYMKYTYDYDVYGNRVDYIEENWSGTDWVKINEIKNVLTYNSYDQIDQNIVRVWDPVSQILINTLKYEYSNFIVFSAINESASTVNNGGRIYPNPFNASATFEIIDNNESSVLVIYDLLGNEVRKIYNSDLENKKMTINRDHLPSGIYFYKSLNNDKITGTGKLIIQ